MPQQRAPVPNVNLPAAVMGYADLPQVPVLPPADQQDPGVAPAAVLPDRPNRRQVCIAGVELSPPAPRRSLRHHRIVNYRDKRKYHASLLTRAEIQGTVSGASPPQDLKDAAEGELLEDQEEVILSRHRPARALKAHKVMAMLPDLVGEMRQGPGFLP